MATPVLTKKQQRQTLSAKKGPAKGLRNVLAQPYETSWPILNEEQCETLESVLKEATPVLKRVRKLIPWSQLRQMKKEERQKAKKDALASQTSLPDEKILSSVVTGVNAVTRSLEKDNVCCVLLDSKVEPLFMIKHVVTMAQNKKVPVVLIPSLKSITQATMGFACAAFALKNIITENADHHFHRLYKEILSASTALPPPKQALKLFPIDNASDSDELAEDSENSSVDEPKVLDKETKPFVVSSNVYKYRSSKAERAFIPPGTAEKADPIKETKTAGDDFIGFGEDSDSMESNAKPMRAMKCKRYMDVNGDNEKEASSNENKRKRPGVTYVSLKVKRVHGNSNRLKATKSSEGKKK